VVRFVVRGAHDGQIDHNQISEQERSASELARLDSSGVCPGCIARGDAAACIGMHSADPGENVPGFDQDPSDARLNASVGS
jgi:hypothetical protein